MTPELRGRLGWDRTLLRIPVQGIDFLCPDLSHCDGKIIESAAQSS